MACMVFIASLFYIISPCTDIREAPKEESEITSQAYFSESVKILEESDGWAKIETVIDGYKGWTKRNAICKGSDTFFTDQSSVVVKVNRCIAHLFNCQDTVYGPILTLPFESKLKVIDPKEKDSTSRWIKVSLPDGREGYIQRGDITFNFKPVTNDEMCKMSERFLNLPYTWGGRSSFGYDCTGFVQMLYRQRGIFLPRDSKDQMEYEGFREIEEKELKAGDLIFFGIAPDKICHAGMYLGNSSFIHATVAENQPWIRISSLSTSEWNGSGRFCFRAFRTLK